MLIVAYLEELPFEALVRPLEEHIHKRRMAKVVAENGESPHEGPTVGVQLGRSHVNLSQQGALEPRKGKTKFEPLKGSGVHKEERFFGVCAVINEHGLALLTRQILHIQVVLPPEDMEFLVSLAFLVLIDVL